MLSVNVQRKHGDFALDVSVDCPYPVTAVFGPSGSGKTTLLNLIAGLDRPDSGSITLDDRVLVNMSENQQLPPERRRVGYVFQDALLFPHLTVQNNLMFAAHLKPETPNLSFDDVADLLELVPLLDRMPQHLSGGEKQRAALGRALLSAPQLLLLDEPLASLDAGLRSRILPYLRRIRDDLKIPMLYVSHSVAEILQLTGQVIVMKAGKVVTSGDFFDLAPHPEVLPLLGEFGFENVLKVSVLENRPSEGISLVDYSGQQLKIPHAGLSVGESIFLGIRANDVILSHTKPEGLSIRNGLQGVVSKVQDAGGMAMVSVDIGKRLMVEVTAEAVRELGIAEGQSIYCLIKAHSIRVA